MCKFTDEYRDHLRQKNQDRYRAMFQEKWNVVTPTQVAKAKHYMEMIEYEAEMEFQLKELDFLQNNLH